MFGYPEYENGVKVIAKIGEINPSMMMDITLYKLKKDEEKTFFFEDKETALLLMTGKIKLSWHKREAVIISRKDIYKENPSCLHFPRGIKVNLVALEETEILVQSTLNEKDFDVKLYLSQDISSFTSCKDKWENTAVREVKTIFDYSNASYSNMVIGEVIAEPGRWWSYIPHSHPQPEVYYYKIPREEGFGACFLDDKAYTIKDGSYSAIEGGVNHPQVTAPGYPMYCCWMIRHLEGNPWVDRVDDERYKWLME